MSLNVNCPGCGAANLNNTKFCVHCGNKIEFTTEVPTPSVKSENGHSSHVSKSTKDASSRANSHQEAGKDGGGDLLIGAIFLIGGIIVTAVSYSDAKPGGTYVVTYGAIIYGIIKIFMGIAKS